MRYLAFVVVISACGQPTPQGEVGSSSGVVEAGVESSGTRIKFSMRRGTDGTVVRAGLYDTQMNSECTLREVPGEVGWRCVPGEVVSTPPSMFLDAQCTVAVLTHSAEYFYSAGEVYKRIGPADPGLPLYRRSSGVCYPTTDTSVSSYVKYELIPTSSFVAFTEELQ